MWSRSETGRTRSMWRIVVPRSRRVCAGDIFAGMATKVQHIELENAIGLSDEQLKLLREDFARLGAVATDLPEQVVKYVVDGANPEVLQRLAATKGCGEALALL